MTELTQFEKSKIICERCEKRIADAQRDGSADDVLYWQGYYADFKKAMIADHGEIAREWLRNR